MTQFDKLGLTRRNALKVGLAGAAASGAMFGATRSAFAADTLAEIKKRGVLSTATEMQFPPFDISDNGTYKGLNRDLIDAVGKQMGLKVSYLDLPWTSILPGLEAKKFDLCIAPEAVIPVNPALSASRRVRASLSNCIIADLRSHVNPTRRRWTQLAKSRGFVAWRRSSFS